MCWVESSEPILSLINQVIIELKAVETLQKAHEVQLVNYLTITGIDSGILVNFGVQAIQIKRKYRIYTPK